MPANDPMPGNNFSSVLRELSMQFESLRKVYVELTQYEQDQMEDYEHGTHQSTSSYYDEQIVELRAWLAKVAQRHADRITTGNTVISNINRTAIANSELWIEGKHGDGSKDKKTEAAQESKV